MPIVINRKTREAKLPEITQEQCDYLCGEVVRAYIRQHPEVLFALEEEPDTEKTKASSAQEN